MTLDQDLRRALRRVDPSPGLADRVLAELPGAIAPQRPAWAEPPVRARRWLGWALAASLMLAASSAGWVQSVRRAEAEQARQEVELALRITSEKLQLVQSRVLARVASYGDRFSMREREQS